MQFWSKIAVDLARGRGSGSNRLEPLQSSAKQSFAVVWSHWDTFRVVFYDFCPNFAVFSRFGEPGPAELPSSLGRAPEPAQSENLEDFGWDFFDLGRILLIFGGFSRFPEDFRDPRKDFRDFREDFSLPARLEPVDFNDISWFS